MTTVTTRPGRRRGAVVLAALAVAFLAVAAGILVHLPGATHQLFDPDEAAIATMGTSLTHGGVLYRDVFDRKPPLAPYLYAASFTLTGDHSIEPLHLLVGVELGLAALVLAAEARRVTGTRRAGWWTAGLLLVGAAAFRPVAAQAANYSQLALLPGCCAIVLARRGTLRAAAFGGLALGVAVLTRQTWILGLAPATLAAAGFGASFDWRRPLALVGASAATIASVALFAPFGAFWHWTFSSNASLLDMSQSHNTGQRLADSLYPFLLAHAAILVLALARGVRRRELDLWLWVLVGIAAFALGFRFFDHYWFQALPPLCLLAGLTTAGLRVEVLAVLAVAALVPAALAWRDAWQPHGFRTDWSSVVATVRSHTGPGDRITVWGSIPELYWLSGRDPGGGLVISDFVVGRTAGRVNGPQRLADATPGALSTFLDSLRSTPPRLFLDTSPAGIRSYQHYPLSFVPPVERFVHERYHRLTTVHGIVVWIENAPRRAPKRLGVTGTSRPPTIHP